MSGSSAVLPAREAAPLGVLSMCGKLESVLVASPGTVGWDERADWRRLGYRRPPNREAAARQHREFTENLRAPGVEVIELGEAIGGAGSFDLTPDAVYCHDASLPSPRGMILLRPGKPARRGEPDSHRAVFAARGIPVVGAIAAPGVAEGGDLVWLDDRTLLAGEGYRTDAAGIAQLAALLARDGVEVVPAPLPHGEGPDRCLHLMSLLSVLDARTLLADPELLAVPTLRRLSDHGFEIVPIAVEERGTMAANVLALGDGELLALRANRRTNERLEAAGYRVRSYEGSEISHNGSGGPTCLTRPLRRETP